MNKEKFKRIYRKFKRNQRINSWLQSWLLYIIVVFIMVHVIITVVAIDNAQNYPTYVILQGQSKDVIEMALLSECKPDNELNTWLGFNYTTRSMMIYKDVYDCIEDRIEQAEAQEEMTEYFAKEAEKIKMEIERARMDSLYEQWRGE